MCFDDGGLVDRIKAALQALFEKQMLMNTLGLTMNGAQDPFASSTLFTTAFEFTWHVARSARNPQVVFMDPTRMPVMAMKASFMQSDNFFASLSSVLPDLLSERSGRVPLPRPRWKELWGSEPSSIAAMEQQLVKLVEQALWAMGSDPAYEIPEEGCQQMIADSLAGDCVMFESWMVIKPKPKTGDASKKKKKKKQQRSSAPHTLEPTVEEEDVEGHASAAIPEENEEFPAIEEDEAKEPSASSLAEGVSDDESVGLGTFHHVTADETTSASEVSRDPTASSTPGLDLSSAKIWCSNWRPPVTPPGWHPPMSPPPSPPSPHKAMHPTQLVCYIWNQTSQFEHSPRSVVGSTQAQSSDTTPQVGVTPFSRGQWTGHAQPGTPKNYANNPVLTAVVRNTFVDIDDPSERPAERIRGSRSLSPSKLGVSRDDHWPDPWHV